MFGEIENASGKETVKRFWSLWRTSMGMIGALSLHFIPRCEKYKHKCKYKYQYNTNTNTTAFSNKYKQVEGNCKRNWRYDRNCFQMSAFPTSSIHCQEIATKKVSKCQKSTLLAQDLIRSVDNRFFNENKWKNWLHKKFLRMSYIGFAAASPWIYNFTLFPLGHLIAEPVGSSLASCRWVMFLNQPASRDTRPNFAFALQLTQTQIQKKTC